MGIILSKFRKKKTSEEVLETIEETISTIEESQKESQLQQRKIRQISYASVTFLVFAAFLYVYFFSKNLRRLEAFLFIIPTIVIAEITRRIISWYYQRKVVKTQKKLIDLRAQKKKILDEVMNNETFNKAKEILEKYAPDQLPKGPGIIAMAVRSTPSNTTLAKTPAFNNSVKKSLFTPNSSVVPSPAINNSQSLVKSYPSRILPRPILPADKTVLEKLVEMIVGDGPGQRFALICSACNSHNGMALKEEFEYLAYKCAYCNHFNPARKQRLVAPRLPDYPSGLSEVSPFNSSTYALKTGLSTVSETPSPSKDKVSEQNADTPVSELDRKINCELNEKANGELESKTNGDSVGNIDGKMDGGVRVKEDSKVSNESKDEKDRETSHHQDGESKPTAMEIDEVEGQKDLAEYVSDEDSLSES